MPTPDETARGSKPKAGTTSLLTTPWARHSGKAGINERIVATLSGRGPAQSLAAMMRAMVTVVVIVTWSLAGARRRRESCGSGMEAGQSLPEVLPSLTALATYS